MAKTTMIRRSTFWIAASVFFLRFTSICSADWDQAGAIAAPEATQAAVALGNQVFAISNTTVAKYDRRTGVRIAVSQGEAKHLNSGFFREGRLYCAHSNYPAVPEKSEIFVLDPATMKLTTFKDFGAYGGSLTWAVFEAGHWWCNFAKYGSENKETFLVKFADNWVELGRWLYPDAVTQRLGKRSISGGIWRDGKLLVSNHDDPVLFRLSLPMKGSILELLGTERVPFPGQGFASDPATGGLVGINRAKREILFAIPSPK